MTTRRRFLGMLGGTTAAALVGGSAVLSGCDASITSGGGQGAGAPAPVAVPDLLLADSAAGLMTIHGTRRAVTAAAVSTPDGTQIYAATRSGGGTLMETIEARTGLVTGRFEVRGDWVPRVVSADGKLVALTAPASGTPHRPAGQERSTIVVVDSSRERYRVELPGNHQPDAFRRDGTGLFVLDWLPPNAPDRYRVRLLHLATGVAAPLLTRDKSPVPTGAEEEMRGDGRQAVLSPDRNTLYTLYTHQPDHQHTRDVLAGGRASDVHAFVHVLNLEQGWAYCLDLPEPFGLGPAAGHTLAVTPDGRSLLVADTTSGRLLRAATETLTVDKVVPGYQATGPASSAVSPDGRRLYLGGAGAVATVDVAALTVGATWQVGAPVRGIALSADGRRLYVGRPGGVTWFDATSGGSLGHAPIADLTELRQAG